MPAGRLAPGAAGARLSELFDEHGRMVYGVCRVLLRDSDEAEDAAQQVFLSAHRSMLGGTEPREPAAWLGAIARNECRARIRSRMARPLALVDERDAAAIDVEHVAAQRAEIDALCAALAELPQQQREAIVLREFYGLSYEEVQAALGITDSAVESLLFRARKRLQSELRPARIASGAFALPLALRDSLAGAVPGFSSGSGAGGLLAKLASLPLVAKLAGAAATLTAAGTIGFVELEARDHSPAGSARSPAPKSVHLRASKSDSRMTRAPVIVDRAGPGGGEHEGRDDEQENEPQEDEAGASENEGEEGGVDADEADQADLAEDEAGSGESDDSSSGSGDSGSEGGED
ncbi:MAG TPA: sigma-70 family RNA polymerase sigma factor [Gaiellaceae bacterium]|jgi:RNA polymerase sigma factor (sigma-70 family)